MPVVWSAALVAAMRGSAIAEEPTGSFAIGAGFDADDGFVAHADLRQTDLFGTGQQLSLTAALSARGQDLRVRTETPPFAGGLTLAAEMFAQQQRYDGFTRAGRGGSLTATQALGASTHAYARYTIEDVAIDADPLAAFARRTGDPMRPPLGDGLWATLGAGVAYDTRDDRVLPTRGTRLALDAAIADPRLGSDHKLVTLGASLDHARPLGPFTLRVAGRAAYVRGLDGAVPLAARLQHDGHADVRGYPLGTLGTRAGLDGRFATGSDLEALGRVELELPVRRRHGLSIAGFLDAGLAHNADPLWGPTGTTVARSAGVSILWRSPIGLLRFDWTIPLDGPDRGQPQFLFGAGSSF